MFSFEDMVKQMEKEVSLYPEKNPERTCADCGKFPPFQPTRFTFDDRENKWVLSDVKEILDGWFTYWVIGTITGYRTICPPCAKKRGINA